MTPPLPLPVRVAAGLVVTAVEQARDLPRQARDLPRLALELPVTAVSQALQASMRVQQKVTELAIKGDRVLGAGPPIEDEPPWATFDDDDVAPPPRRRNDRAAEPAGAPSGLPVRPAPDRAASDLPAPGPPDLDPRASDLPVPDLSDVPVPVDPGALDAELDDAELVDAELVDADPVDAGPVDAGPAAVDTAPDTADVPPVLPGYADLTIPQLRGKLRHLGVDDLRALLAWEHAHGDRPPYVTMLTNRIATVSGG